MKKKEETYSRRRKMKYGKNEVEKKLKGRFK